ncbi:MAG: lytic murein transglycosylase [Burkholderiaceae bacterium]|jgi:lytic murein transglycosylase|nr:lytic murein transglycosylase [Burkholderiaceae bacterium]
MKFLNKRFSVLWSGIVSKGFFLAGLALSASAVSAQTTSFESCVKGLRKSVVSQGIQGEVFDRAMQGVEPDPDVLKAFSFQPEFRTAIWDYLAGLVDQERVDDGRDKLKEWSKVLDVAEQKYGVDRNVIVAVWGVESNYGRIQGKRDILRSLTTLICADKRQAFFRGELLATLRILQSGDIPPELLVGSWAGAFGQTQFMPTTYQRLAVDFDGDGRRDIVGSVPDALGSTANFLKRAGWVTGQPWGVEVKIPANYSGPSGRRTKQSFEQWKSLGIAPVKVTAKNVQVTNMSNLPGTTQAALLLPAGAKGPAFLVFRNFDAIFSYNAAESYALAIAHLSDRMRGSGMFQTAWPTDDPGTSRAERRQIQQALLDRGYDIGEVDGLIGAKSRAAISAFQQSKGITVNGRAGQQVLKALR